MRNSAKMEAKAWKSMPKRERAALLRTMKDAAMGDFDSVVDGLTRYAVARYQHSGKAARDAAADARKRVLVGARLPRETAERVKAAARESGRSVYRFVADAVERELERG